MFIIRCDIIGYNRHMRSKLIIIVSIIVALGVMVFFILNMKSSDSAEQNSTTSNASGMQHTVTEHDTNGTYTAAQVAEHNSKSDCWTIINGNVYDITEHIPTHEGGDEIVRACGIDATSLFTQRETTSGEKIGSGTPHSAQAEQMLAEHKIGTLVQ